MSFPLTRRAVARGSDLAYLQVGVAPRSESNLVADFDGTVRGVFVATYDELPVGSRVMIAVGLPGNVEVVSAARVEWVRRPGSGGVPGIGLRFEVLGEDDVEILRTF